MNPFATTAIGSLPLTDTDQAVELNLQYLDIPCWPQLPKLSFLENMYVQFCEGFPGIVIDESQKKIYVKEDSPEQEEFFQAVVNNDYEYFKISENYARGLYAFVKKAKGRQIVKGQITGPVSFGLSITQEDGRAIFYNEQLREIVIKHLTMKTLWQYRFLKQIAHEVIIFIDEPYLSSIGSGFLTISETDIQDSLSEVVNLLKNEGVIVGIHCCGNTDWEKLSNLNLDIINYDTYNYPQSLLIHPEVVSSHINKGGYIAWGIVPSSREIEDVNLEGLMGRMKDVFQKVRDKKIDINLLKERSLLTPSCGTGTVSEREALRVYDNLRELKRSLKEVI